MILCFNVLVKIFMKYYGHHKDRVTCEVDSVVPAVRKEKEIYGKSYIEIPKLNNF